MKVAVSSQNRREITGHAGKCRKFWIYQAEEGRVAGKALLELPIEQSFHESHPTASHPLDDVDVLISGGMGFGLQQRLRERGVQVFITAETDPDRAVAALLDGSLRALSADLCRDHEAVHTDGLHANGHGHRHAHHHGHEHGHCQCHEHANERSSR